MGRGVFVRFIAFPVRVLEFSILEYSHARYPPAIARSGT